MKLFPTLTMVFVANALTIAIVSAEDDHWMGKLKDSASKVSEAAKDLGEASSEKAKAIADDGKDVAERLSESAADMAEKGKEKSSELYQKAKESTKVGLANASESVENAYDTVKQKVVSPEEEQSPPAVETVDSGLFSWWPF